MISGRSAAAVMGSTWLIALAIGGPAPAQQVAQGEPPGSSPELQQEFPLHESRQCCDEEPASASPDIQPARPGDDGGLDLPASAPLWIALLGGTALGLWFVARSISFPHRTRAALAGGQADPAMDRPVDSPRRPWRPRRRDSPARTPDLPPGSAAAAVRSDLQRELAEWTKLELVWSALSLDLSDRLRKRIDDGREHWARLRRADERQPVPAAVEAAAVDWTKDAIKARRKLRRDLRRDAMPDPFRMPDIDAKELADWITRGALPGWAVELRARAQPDASAQDPDEFATRLLEAAQQRLRRSWRWTGGVDEAVAEAAAGLSRAGGDQAPVRDAIALGYWVRQVEPDFTIVNIAQPEFVARVRGGYEQGGPAEIALAMADVAAAMPAVFYRGPGVWAAVQAAARSILEQRERPGPAHDGDPGITREASERAFALGYGLGVTVESLGIAAVDEPAA